MLILLYLENGPIRFNGLLWVNAVCIGRQTAAEVRKRGMRKWVSEKATLEALLKRVEEATHQCKDEREGEI